MLSVPWRGARAGLGIVPWFESRYESGLAALRTGCVRQELKDELKSAMGWKSFPDGQWEGRLLGQQELWLEG